jgi:hypothetical protein
MNTATEKNLSGIDGHGGRVHAQITQQLNHGNSAFSDLVIAGALQAGNHGIAQSCLPQHLASISASV